MAMCIRASALCFLSVFLVFAFSSAGHACRIDEKTNDHICSESDRTVVTHNAPTAPVGGGGAPSSSSSGGSGSPVVPGGEPIDIGTNPQPPAQEEPAPKDDVPEDSRVQATAGQCVPPYVMSTEPTKTQQGNKIILSYALGTVYKDTAYHDSDIIFSQPIGPSNGQSVSVTGSYRRDADGNPTHLEVQLSMKSGDPLLPGTYGRDVVIMGVCRKDSNTTIKASSQPFKFSVTVP